jgi:hypothetical protein
MCNQYILASSHWVGSKGQSEESMAELPMNGVGIPLRYNRTKRLPHWGSNPLSARRITSLC